jgi:hypothetical protein
MKLNKNLVPILSDDVIVRKDKNGMLLFQVYSDEMYFIPFSAYHSFLVKCDGSKTLKEIMDGIKYAATFVDKELRINNFINGLLQRKIITLW